MKNEYTWQEKYIELQRNLINELMNLHILMGKGFTMKELKAIKELEDFENSLPWNKGE